jgi:hypothetical protein
VNKKLHQLEKQILITFSAFEILSSACRELFNKVGHSCLSPLPTWFSFNQVNPGLLL